MLVGIGLYHLLRDSVPRKVNKPLALIANMVAVALVGVLLANHWLPLGPTRGFIRNLVFVVILIGGLLVFFKVFQRLYPYILGWCLDHKLMFLCMPVAVLLLGGFVWLGFGRVFFLQPLNHHGCV